MAGPRFFRAVRPLTPADVQAIMRGHGELPANVAPIARRGLGDIPAWDRTSAAIPTPPTSEGRVLYPPMSGQLPGGSYLAMPPMPAGVPPAPGTPAPSGGPTAGSIPNPTVASGVDWRLPNLVNFVSFTITPSTTTPVLPVDYHRAYILIQNNDPVSNMLVTFGVQPSGTNSLVLAPNVGFVWDSVVPYTTMYVANSTTFTVSPIGIAGTQVSPSTIPVGV